LDENATNTIMIKYIVVKAPSSYNLLLGRPSLNRQGAVVSTLHMKLKLPSPEGKVITMRVDPKVACKCYKNSLRSRKGTYTIRTRLGRPDVDIEHPQFEERRPEPPGEELEEKIKEIISKNMNAFA